MLSPWRKVKTCGMRRKLTGKNIDRPLIKVESQSDSKTSSARNQPAQQLSPLYLSRHLRSSMGVTDFGKTDTSFGK